MTAAQRLYNRYGPYLSPVSAKKLLITALAKCDPIWGIYSTFTSSPIDDDEFADFIASLSKSRKQNAREEDYEDAAKKYFQAQWHKKLAVIVPTANRPKSIEYYLRQVGRAHEFYGIDLIFYDSSDDDSTKRVVEEFTEGKCEHIIYERYTGGFDGISIDEKGITAYSKYSLKYEYLWMTRDGWIIDINSIRRRLGEILCKNPDACVLYAPGEDIQGIGYKEYTNPTELFRDSCRRMTVLGSCFFSSSFMQKVLKNHPLDMKINYGMWQPIAMFAQWAEQPLFAISDTTNFYIGNIFGTEKSFWNKNGRALWQVTENWYMLISNLPDIYDNDKPEVLKIGHAIFTPFAFRQLLIMRTTGSLTFGKVKQYAKYFPLVSNHPLKWFYMISLIPRFICRAMLNPNNLFRKIMAKFAHTYRDLKRFNDYPQPLPKNHDISAFDADKKNDGIVFSNHDLCILLPVCGRVEILQDNLKKTLAQYKAYHIPVIVYDASDGSEIRDLVCDELAPRHPNIRYVRYEGAVDVFSDDEFIISAYRRFGGEYRYIWLMRDICLANLQTCAFQIWQAIREDKDVIVFSRERIDSVDKLLCATEYDDARELFRDTFNSCLFPENMIIRSDMMTAIMREQPLDESNRGFWRTAAPFHYIAVHLFTAAVIAADIFCYHPSNLIEAQERNSLWQWVDRLYAMFIMLPKEYADERESVLRRMDQIYCLLRPIRLLRVRISGKYRLRDVYRYGRNAAFVSGTSFSQLIRVGLTPRFLAKLKFVRPMLPLWRHSLLDVHADRIGDFSDS